MLGPLTKNAPLSLAGRKLQKALNQNTKTQETGPADEVSLSSLCSEKPYTPVQLTRAANGNPTRVSSEGFNAPFHCQLESGEPGVFKAIPTDSDWSHQSWVDEMAKEVVASNIMRQFSPSAIEYKASATVADGLTGVSSKLVDITSLGNKPQTLNQISNPDEAIAGGVADAWLGNYDRIENDGNVWIGNQDRKVVYGDYGCAFHQGVKVLGLPKVNSKLFQAHATPQRVEPTLQKIRNLSDKQVAKMVREAGKDCPLLRPEIEKSIVAVLIHNRDELRKENPFKGYYDGGTPKGTLSQPLVEALSQGVQTSHPDTTDPKELSLRTLQRVRGQRGQKGRDTDMVRSSLELALDVSKSGAFSPIPVRAQDLVAWRGVIRKTMTPQQQAEHQVGFIIAGQ